MSARGPAGGAGQSEGTARLPRAGGQPGAWGEGGPHHALHAVGEQQDDAVLPDPFGLPGADELVDDALGSVVEVPKLGFPEHQGVGAGHGKAQLEACRNSKVGVRERGGGMAPRLQSHAYPGHRTQTVSCCRRCREPGWATGGSSGCRSSCPRSGHAARGGDGWKRGKRSVTPCQMQAAASWGSHLAIPPSRLLGAMLCQQGIMVQGGKINNPKDKGHVVWDPFQRLWGQAQPALPHLKVPLSTSCPLRRMWMPSFSREPNAMYSASAQSTVLFFTISPRVFRIRLRPARTGDGSMVRGGDNTSIPKRARGLTMCARPGAQEHSLWAAPRMSCSSRSSLN